MIFINLVDTPKRAMIPEIPLRTVRPTTASPTSRATISGQTLKATEAAAERPDLFLDPDAGALTFHPTAEAPARDLMLERARGFLQVLRAGSADDTLSFGGAVNTSGVDILKSLANYYPALKTAKTLGAEEDLAAGANAFLSQISLPTDLRALAAKASGLESFRPKAIAEPPGPIGTRGYSPAHFEFVNNQRFPTGRAAPAGELELDDEGVREAMKSFYGGVFDPKRFQSAAMEDRIRILRLFARAKELGVNVSFEGKDLDAIRWPATPRSGPGFAPGGESL